MHCIYLFSVLFSVRPHLSFDSFFSVYTVKMYWPFKGKKGLKEAGRRNAAVEQAKIQLCSASLASGLTLRRNMKHGSCFHRAVWWKRLLTERKQHFYYKLWDRMGSESLGSIPPAQLPYNSLKDKSAWVCTLHGNGRWQWQLWTPKNFIDKEFIIIYSLKARRQE